MIKQLWAKLSIGRYTETQYRSKCTACHWISPWCEVDWEADDMWFRHKQQWHF